MSALKTALSTPKRTETTWTGSDTSRGKSPPSHDNIKTTLKYLAEINAARNSLGTERRESLHRPGIRVDASIF